MSHLPRSPGWLLSTAAGVSRDWGELLASCGRELGTCPAAVTEGTPGYVLVPLGENPVGQAGGRGCACTGWGLPSCSSPQWLGPQKLWCLVTQHSWSEPSWGGMGEFPMLGETKPGWARLGAGAVGPLCHTRSPPMSPPCHAQVAISWFCCPLQPGKWGPGVLRLVLTGRWQVVRGFPLPVFCL